MTRTRGQRSCSVTRGSNSPECTSKHLVPERFRGRHPSHRENYNAHPRARQMGAAMNLFGLRKDGTEFPVDIMLKPMYSIAGGR